MKVHVIQCKIGNTSPGVAISSAEESFFRWMASSISELDERQIAISSQRPICITNNDIQAGGANSYVRVIETIDLISHFDNSDFLVVDIEVRKIAQLRAHLLKHIFTAVEHKLKELSPAIPSKCVFILEDLPPDKDIIFDAIQSIAKITDVLLFDEYGKNNKDICLNNLRFRKLRTLSKQDPRLAIRHKMVRHFGHFQKMTQTGVRCVRHFYDGRYCIQEIADYLIVELQDEISANSSICYHSKLSPWLINSVLSLKDIFPCEIIDVENEIPDTSKDLFIILDFIDSGSTLVELVDKIQKEPKRIISILATDNIDNKLGKREILRPGKASLLVEYVLMANIKRLGSSPCKLCNIGLPVDTLQSLSLTGPLRSIDFWEMAIDANLSLEEADPPSYRSAKNHVINSHKMLSDNGGFIASRVLQLTNEYYAHSDISIIYPASEKGSGEFALKLELMLSKDLIAIPRGTIDRFTSKNISFSEQETSSEWYIRLSAPTVTRCIVIDDLCVSGTTVKGIHIILEKLEKDVVAVIPLLDINPEREIDISTCMIPLYEWQERPSNDPVT